ncbi:MAG TPA: SRPBCC family protein [Gaiellaceae bacterium]|nr:SRPBCC family protein [Gaiellaceae bacterium]
MPVQQAVDVAVPVETAYNQWSQFEDWPQFMHRVTRVTQEDPCTVSFATKIWGKTKEFEAQIETQRPDERIKWRVSQGITHTGVVTFHELAPRLTRIEMNVDVDPGSLIEKAARGMRHIKRAMRADLHRFKAFIEMQEMETGAWRGVIEEGELVDEHDDSYDEERDYSDVEDLKDEADAEGEGDEDEDEEESQRERSQRFKRQAERSSSRSRSGASSSRSGGGNSSSKSSSGGSRSRSSGRGQSRSRGSANGGGNRSGSSSKKSSGGSSSRSRSGGSGRKKSSSRS